MNTLNLALLLRDSVTQTIQVSVQIQCKDGGLRKSNRMSKSQD